MTDVNYSVNSSVSTSTNDPSSAYCSFDSLEILQGESRDGLSGRSFEDGADVSSLILSESSFENGKNNGLTIKRTDKFKQTR